MQRYFDSPRFDGIIRLYSARQVVEQRGTIPTDYPVAREAAALIDTANPMLASDVGVAAVLAAAALAGCRLNVEVNLAFLKDAALASEVRAELDAAEGECERCRTAVLAKLRTRQG